MHSSSIDWTKPSSKPVKIIVSAGIITLGAILGAQASMSMLALLIVTLCGLVLLRRLLLGVFLLIPTALLLPVRISTGTEVPLNAVSLLLPAIIVLWLLTLVLQKRVNVVPSKINKPLFLFVLFGLISLAIGTTTWNPIIPRSSHTLLVHVAQWAIFALSAGALLLTGNLIKDELLLQRLTFFFLFVGGIAAILYVIPGVSNAIKQFTTVAYIRAPLWTLFTGLAGGQLLFNRELSDWKRLFLLTLLGAVLVYSASLQQESASNWIGVLIVAAALVWLRWSQLRWPIVLGVILLTVSGYLYSNLYQFAGGDEEWFRSGGTRIALIKRVVELTLEHNAITGLGPAAYRQYGFVEPLQYAYIYWLEPRLSSHNNYVDIFAHMGIVGLTLFFWLAVRLTRLGLRLREVYQSGFAAGYLNAMLAVGMASLALMMFADWILPFVYNIGFPGFQASVLVWLFMGGLVSLEQMVDRQDELATEG